MRSPCVLDGWTQGHCDRPERSPRGCAVKVVSKVGAGAQSAPRTVVTSAGPGVDFTCRTSRVCRWGDYAAATPDPAAPLGARTGRVVGTSQYTMDGRLAPRSANWLTRNFSFTP